MDRVGHLLVYHGLAGQPAFIKRQSKLTDLADSIGWTSTFISHRTGRPFWPWLRPNGDYMRDCIAVARAIISSTKYPPEQIAIYGHSAGGDLAIVMGMLMHDEIGSLIVHAGEWRALQTILADFNTNTGASLRVPSPLPRALFINNQTDPLVKLKDNGQPLYDWWKDYAEARLSAPKGKGHGCSPADDMPVIQRHLLRQAEPNNSGVLWSLAKPAGKPAAKRKRAG